MNTLNNYTKKLLIGKHNGKSIFLSAPSWECGWYWGFGYIGNKNCHYHIDGLTKIETYNTEKKCFEYKFVNLYDGFKEHFGNSFVIKRDKDIWTLAELFNSFCKLKEAAEIFGRGGTHYTSNPAKGVILNKDEAERINNIVLPKIFEEIYKIFERNAESEKEFQTLIKINLSGDTSKVVDFMMDKQIHTDDLKNIEGLTKDDFNNIHTYYWRRFHEKK